MQRHSSWFSSGAFDERDEDQTRQATWETEGGGEVVGGSLAGLSLLRSEKG